MVKLDEYHPDDRVAAKYADQNSRLFTRRVLTDRIRYLRERSAVLTYEERAEMKSAQADLNRVNEDIENFEKEEA